MVSWEMEIISPTSYLPKSNWFLEDQRGSIWNHVENKLFENALAVYDKETSDRWQKVAAMIPGKTILEVIKHYKDLEDDVTDIEAGLIQIPGYRSSSFTLEWVNNCSFDGLKSSCGAGEKRLPTRPEQERKKGVPWTQDEHRLFLMGLKKYGKGDWRNISRNFVVSRTPTQVASHAQKYFIRQGSRGKDKRRSSIHDITTINLTDNRESPSPAQTTTLPMPPNLASGMKTPEQFSLMFEPNHSNEKTSFFSRTLSQRQGDFFGLPPYEMTSYGVGLNPHNFQRGILPESHLGSGDMVFCIQSAQQCPHGQNSHSEKEDLLFL